MTERDQDVSEQLDPTPRLEQPPVQLWPKIAAGLIAVLVAIVLIWGPVDLARTLLEWWQQETGIVGAVGFALVYIVATACFVPAAVLGVGAGFLFGPIGGAVIAGLCRPLGALLAFMVGRHLARRRVQKWIQEWPKFEAIDRMTEEEPIRIVALLRIVPVLTFNVTNYVFGLTSVDWKKYFAATALSVFPGSLFYVYIGVITGDLTRAVAMEEAPQLGDHLVTWIIGGIAFAGALGYMFYRARKYWEEMVERQEAEIQTEGSEPVAEEG